VLGNETREKGKKKGVILKWRHFHHIKAKESYGGRVKEGKGEYKRERLKAHKSESGSSSPIFETNRRSAAETAKEEMTHGWFEQRRRLRKMEGTKETPSINGYANGYAMREQNSPSWIVAYVEGKVASLASQPTTEPLTKEISRTAGGRGKKRR